MNSTSLTLFFNYLRTGTRFLWKTRGFSSLNIIGLSLGISAAWLAYIFVSGELSFDRYHKNGDRVYRIASETTFNGQKEIMGGASYIMGKEYSEQISGIEKATWFKNTYFLMRYNNETKYQQAHYATKDLFDMLDFEFISGTHQYFDDQNEVIISKSIAEKLENPDQLVLIIGGNERIFDVVGIYRNPPTNSSIRPEVVMHMSFYTNNAPKRRLSTWFDINMNVLVMLKKGVSQDEVSKQMTDLILANGDVSELEPVMLLQPLTRIHLDIELRAGNGLMATADISTVRLAGLVGLLCLMISCINFSNFTLGNNLVRSKEVGIRKVVGAGKGSILGQFITESILTTAIAAILAIIAVFATLPLFTELIQNQNYTISNLLDTHFLFGAFTILLLTAFISGLYPALILSNFKIVNATKNVLKVGNNNWAGQVFISTQFGIAIFLIVGTIIAHRQFDHLLNFDLGYNDENVVSLRVPSGNEEFIQVFRNKLMNISGIKSTTAISGYNGTDFLDKNIRFDVSHLRTDANMMDLLEIPILKGRNFEPDSENDLYNSILVNETFIKKAQIKNPIGKVIPFQYGELENPTIIGVVKDYYFRSSRYSLDPLVIYQSPQYQLQELIIKTETDVEVLLPEIEKVFKQSFYPLPFSYELMTDYNLRMLSSENRMKKLASSGSVIAIILASLGLLGMIGTYIRQRMKEVSIRKINGASPISLYSHFSKKFVLWVAVGFVMGFFPAIYFLNNWLQNYPHQISIDWTVGLLAIGIVLFIFLAAVVIQLTKVVYENPVKFLRDE